MRVIFLNKVIEFLKRSKSLYIDFSAKIRREGKSLILNEKQTAHVAKSYFRLIMT